MHSVSCGSISWELYSDWEKWPEQVLCYFGEESHPSRMVSSSLISAHDQSLRSWLNPTHSQPGLVWVCHSICVTASGARQMEMCHVKYNTLCVIFVSKKGKLPYSCAFFAHTLTQSYCSSYGFCCCSNEPFTNGNDSQAVFTALYAEEVLWESEHSQFVEALGNVTLWVVPNYVCGFLWLYCNTINPHIKVSYGIVFHA